MSASGRNELAFHPGCQRLELGCDFAGATDPGEAVKGRDGSDEVADRLARFNCLLEEPAGGGKITGCDGGPGSGLGEVDGAPEGGWASGTVDLLEDVGCFPRLARQRQGQRQAVRPGCWCVVRLGGRGRRLRVPSGSTPSHHLARPRFSPVARRSRPVPHRIVPRRRVRTPGRRSGQPLRTVRQGERLAEHEEVVPVMGLVPGARCAVAGDLRRLPEPAEAAEAVRHDDPAPGQRPSLGASDERKSAFGGGPWAARRQQDAAPASGDGVSPGPSSRTASAFWATARASPIRPTKNASLSRRLRATRPRSSSLAA